MTRDKAVAIARDNLWQIQERGPVDAGFLPEPQVAITEGSLVNTLAALGLIKFDKDERAEGERFVHEMADVWRKSAQSSSRDYLGRAIIQDLDLAGFQIVRKP